MLSLLFVYSVSLRSKRVEFWSYKDLSDQSSEET